jgi:hypothetical protein
MGHATTLGIWKEIGASREERPRRDLVEKAVRYAPIRFDWFLTPPAERGAMEMTLTAAHNALIDSCNILCRAVLRAGEETGWRGTLRDDRREIGDFACHRHAILEVSAR